MSRVGFRGISGAGLWLALLVPAAAQDYQLLPEERWGRLSEGEVGKSFRLQGRWEQVYGDGLLLYKAPIETGEFIQILAGAESPLRKRLANNEDSGGKRLEKKQSMVEVRGIARRVGARIVLDVERVDKQKDLDEQIKDEMRGLRDADALQALGRRAAELARRYEDRALALALQEVVRRELTARRDALKPNDAQARMELAQRYAKEAREEQKSIELYAEVFEMEAAPAEQRQEAREMLRRLKAVPSRRPDGSGYAWIQYDEFKRLEGFIARKNAAGEMVWVRRERAELEDRQSEEIKRQAAQLQPIRMNPSQHAKEARAGRVERGQNLAEAGLAVGLPLEVSHMQGPPFQQQKEDEKSLWTQWVLRDGRRLYFVNQELFSVAEKGDPWPEK